MTCVLHIMWSLDFGGIERLVLDLCKEQRKNGMEAQVLVGRATGRLAEQFADERISVIDANLKNGFDMGRSGKTKILESMGKADIIHIHAFSPVFSKMAVKSGTPIVFTDHGNYGLGRKRTWRDHVKFAMQSRFFKKHVNFMTFNSHYTKGLAKGNFKIDGIQNKVVYNGINLEKYEDRTGAIEVDIPAHLQDKFIIGTTSRFAGFKRIDRLIEAFALLPECEDCCLLLVGDGPLRSSYEDLVKTLGIEEQVYFTGFQSNVRDYQMAMDVCVFPSCGEPFGLVAVETLALGKPTLVMRDGGGIVEVVEPVEPDNIVDGVQGLASRLAVLKKEWSAGFLENSKYIDVRRERAQRFKISHMTSEFSDVYSQCLQSSSVNQ